MRPSALSALLTASLLVGHAALGGDSSDALRARLSGPKVGAHQGGIYGLRPNTLRGFEKARRKGADIVELDLRISKDGVPMVFHDPKLDTWTGCRGQLRDKTAAEIKRCRLKLSRELIPTFEEVLAWARGRIVLNAEFKDLAAIEPVIALVRKHQAHAWTYFQAQSRTKYDLARSLDPDLAILVSPKNESEALDYLSLNDPALLVFEIDKEISTPDMIRRIHDAGKLTSKNAWHFSKTHEFFGATCDRVFAHGIDIAITNRPVSCVRQKNGTPLKIPDQT